MTAAIAGWADALTDCAERDAYHGEADEDEDDQRRVVAARNSAGAPCPECGCDPRSPWYCGCSTETCPCHDDGDDDE